MATKHGARCDAFIDGQLGEHMFAPELLKS